MVREENITFDDVSAVVDAGAQAGVAQARTSLYRKRFWAWRTQRASSMTTREDVVYFTLASLSKVSAKKPPVILIQNFWYVKTILMKWLAMSLKMW